MSRAHQFELANPFRSPAWRMKRVLSLVDAQPKPKMASRKFDDKYVKAYRNFLLKYRASDHAPDPELAKMQLFHEDPGLYYAHEFYYNPDREWREWLEARILAREPDDYIAFEFSTVAETVDWYEKLFYNIRDRMASKSYIVKTILGDLAQRSYVGEETVTKDQKMIAYKLFAYFGGPLVLDIIVSGFDESNIPIKNEKANEFVDNSMKMGIRQKSSIAAQFVSINKFNVMQLFEIHQRFMTFEAEVRAAAGGAGADYEANIERFFEQIPLAIGTASQENRTAVALEFEQTSAEPRPQEQMELAQGRVPDTLKVKAEYVRPEPRKGEGVLKDAADKPNE